MNVTSMVPPSRLLIIKTDEIGDKLRDIEEFFNIPPESLDGDKTHLYKNRSKLRILSQMEKGYVEERIKANCGYQFCNLED